MEIGQLTRAELQRVKKCPVDCTLLKHRIEHLADYFTIVDSLTADEVFWFRGHAEVDWDLIPSALRYKVQSQRDKAVVLLDEFRRIAELKISRPPRPAARLEWVQLAQHYGLPTRLLDWTQSATIGLFFACLPPDDRDGVLFVLNPSGLNALGPAKVQRVLTMHEDEDLILQYLSLTGAARGARGRAAVAINPVWNSERLILQRGGFTLHGSKFALDRKQAPSLVGIPIVREKKARLRHQLHRIGVDRLTVFPELEHTCAFLREQIREELS